MTVPGVYSPSQAERVDATIRAAAESDGVQDRSQAIWDAIYAAIRNAPRTGIGIELCSDKDIATACRNTAAVATEAALNALRALEGE